MIRDIDLSVFVRLGDKLTAPLKNTEKIVADAADRMNKRLKLSLKLGAAGAVSAGASFGIQRMVSGLTDGIREVEKARGELATLGVKDLDAVVRKGQEMQMQLAGVTADAFVRASYDIKSGISTLTDQGVAEMTASAMVTAKATKAQAEQMTSLYATSYGIFKKQFNELSDAEFGDTFGAMLAKSVQQFKTDGTQMQQAIESAGAGAVNLGMSMREQMALLGMMQQQMAAGEAGTALRAFATNAAAADEAFKDLAKGAKNPVRVRVLDENGALRSMVDVMADLKARYGETLDAMEATEIKKAFGTDEAMKMINALYGQEAAIRANADALAQAGKQGAAFTTEMAKAADANWASVTDRLSQIWDVFRQKLAIALLPTLEKLAPMIEEAITGLVNWADAHPDLLAGIGAVVIGLGAITTVLAPVLVGLGSLVGSWAVASYGATRLALVLRSLAPAFRLVGQAVLWMSRALLANPIGLAIATIAGGAYLIYRNWDRVGPWFGRLFGNIRVFAGGLAQFFRGAFTGDMTAAVAGLKRIWEGLTGYFRSLWAGIAGVFRAAWNGTIRPITDKLGVTDDIIRAWNALSAALQAALAAIGNAFSAAWNGYIRPAIDGLFSISGVGAVWEAVQSAIGAVLDALSAKFAAVWAVISPVIDALKWARDKGSEAIAALNGGPSGPGAVTVKGQTLPNGGAGEFISDGVGGFKQVPARAQGGGFGPGPLLVGERGPEVRFESAAGFIANNGALRGMLTMMERIRALMQSAGASVASGAAIGVDPASAMTPAGTGRARQVNYTPHYNIVINGSGLSPAELRGVVRQELRARDQQAHADMRRLMHD
ncbi:MAG: phage tail tape measure protein [Paracoccus sp. (in: a-proteobacteria)]